MKILLYGDVNLNIIDGSSVWLSSMVEVLADLADETHVLLKAPIENDRLVRTMSSRDRVCVHEADSTGETGELSPSAAAAALTRIDEQHGFDVIIVRGINACEAAVGQSSLRPKLWSYVTELPFPYARVNRTSAARIWNVVSKSYRVFAQTEPARSYLEAICNSAPGKVYLLPPMVPNRYFELGRKHLEILETAGSESSSLGSEDRPIRLVYSGKLAEDWRVREILELPRALGARGIHARLDIVGDKFQRSARNRTFAQETQEIFESLPDDAHPGVVWHGGLPRDEAIDVVASADLGLGWRSSELDSSLEISTKALEYSAVGTPPIINKSNDHSVIWGKDYPFLITRDDLESVCDSIEFGAQMLSTAAGAAIRAAEYYSIESAKDRLSSYFNRVLSLNDQVYNNVRKIRVGIASHDLKFMGELIDFLEADSRFEVRLDSWKSLHENNPERSQFIRDWADVVLCEWAGPNAVWYSQNLRPGQKLVVRLHRFELWAPWIPKINFSNVSKLVFVSDYFMKKSLSLLGDILCETEVIPNAIDLLDFDRPKLPGAEFRLGMLGMVSFGKRPDRALDLLASLLEVDSRYTLHIRGRMPWEYSYEWGNPVQRELYLEFFGRLRESELLRSHVSFEEFGPDVASWFRKIGIVLSPSTSRFESFHLAPAEGMAAGCPAVVWPREGSAEIFGESRVFDTLGSARDYALSLREPGTYQSESDSSRAWAGRWDVSEVMSRWSSLLTNLGDISNRRGR